MSDLISRADAIEAIQNAYCKPCKERGDDYNEVRCRACNFDDAIIQIEEVPSADAVDVAHDIPEYCRWSQTYTNMVQSAMADTKSADAKPKWNCTANFVAEQLDRLRNMTDEEKWEFFKRFFEMKGGAE